MEPKKDLSGYEGCDLVLVEQLLQQRRDGLVYLSDLQRQITEARERHESVEVLSRARQSVETKLCNIKRALKAECHRAEQAHLIAKTEKLAEILNQKDLVRGLTLFQCLRKAAAILGHRADADDLAIRDSIKAYLNKRDSRAKEEG